MPEIYKKNLIFAAGILLLLAFLYFISGVKQPPPLPPDAEHRDLTGNEDCRACHDKDGEKPLGPTHPPKDDCVYCHIEKAMKRGVIKYKIIQKINQEKQQHNN